MSGAGWHLVERRGLLLALCDALERIPGTAHAFSTRCADGGRAFDLGGAGPIDGEIRDRRRRLISAAGIAPRSPLVLRQVHEATVVRVAEQVDGVAADAAIWLRADGGERVPSVRTADCVPILIADREGRAAAAVHAGWRGTARGVAVAAVESLVDAGMGRVGLVAAMGPAILACCYEVENDVLARVAEASAMGGEGIGRPSGRPGRARLDLHAANRAQLVRAGLDPVDIHAAPWCTRCRTDLFFSYRRDGKAAGRQMAVIGGRSDAR